MPATWNAFSTHLELWHGCLASDARSIGANGIDLSVCRPNTDFGRGFYLTTNRSQAERWATRRLGDLFPSRRRTESAVILRFRVPREELTRLDSLIFVRGDADHAEYWSFVLRFRQGGSNSIRTHLHPKRTAPNDWYDLVCGPVAMSYRPDHLLALRNSDQFSFHTPVAIAILNDVIVQGAPNFEAVQLP